MLNRKTVKDLRDKLQGMIELEGYEILVGNASFNDDEVTFKLNIKVKGGKYQA